MKAKCPWEPIDNFFCLAEFQRFVAWMEDQVAQDIAVEVPVEKPYGRHHMKITLRDKLPKALRLKIKIHH
jgi:hypothetical protein